MFEFRNHSNSVKGSVYQAWTLSWDWPSFSWVIWCQWAEVRKFLNLFKVAARVFKRYGRVLAISVFYYLILRKKNPKMAKAQEQYKLKRAQVSIFHEIGKCDVVQSIIPPLKSWSTLFCKILLSSIYSICNKEKD